MSRTRSTASMCHSRPTTTNESSTSLLTCAFRSSGSNAGSRMISSPSGLRRRANVVATCGAFGKKPSRQGSVTILISPRTGTALLTMSGGSLTPSRRRQTTSTSTTQRAKTTTGPCERCFRASDLDRQPKGRRTGRPNRCHPAGWLGQGRSGAPDDRSSRKRSQRGRRDDYVSLCRCRWAGLDPGRVRTQIG